MKAFVYRVGPRESGAKLLVVQAPDETQAEQVAKKHLEQIYGLPIPELVRIAGGGDGIGWIYESICIFGYHGS